MSGIITFLVIAGLILIAWQASNLVALYFGIPFLRTPKSAIKDILELAEIKPGEKFFELGSGWGEILSHVSKKYRANAYGLEVSPIHLFVSSLLNYNNDLVKIRWADFSDFTLKRADIVYCNLSLKLLKKLEKKFEDEFSPGTRLISYRYYLPHREPKFTYQVGRVKIYFYQY